MIWEQIKSDIVSAQKARDARLLSILRMLSSELSYKVIDSGELSDEQVIAVLQKEAKKRTEASEIYKKANDVARSEQEEYELGVIKKYLPQMMGEAEVRKVIEEVASESGKTGGQLVGLAMAKLRGKVDGSLVAKIVNELHG